MWPATLGCCIFLLRFPLASAAQSAPPPFKVKWKGEMRTVMREGDLRGTTALDTLLKKPHVYAIGPLENLSGEILVLDGQPYISQVRKGRPEVQHSTKEMSAFLVYAQVSKWAETPIPPDIRDQVSLEAFVKETAKENGYDVKEPFPFLLRGNVTNLELHIMNKAAEEPYSFEDHDRLKARFPLAQADVEILGFYSTRHQGVFTHHDSFTHLHVITKDHSISGHLDSFKPKPGQLKLYLPYLPEEARKKKTKVSVKKLRPDRIY